MQTNLSGFKTSVISVLNLITFQL